MEVRVVWGLSATMATFWPISAFSSVDFPALGRPRMETNPDLKLLFMGNRLRLGDANLVDAQLVAGQHLEVKAAAVHGLAGFGNASQPLAGQAADGGGFDVFFLVKVLNQIADAIEIETAGDDVAAVSVFDHVGIGFVFVADLSD